MKATARQAGMLYLLTAILAPFTLIYILSTLFVQGNATATASNIAAHETLFRLGIVTDLFGGVIGNIAFPALLGELALMLWLLFKGVKEPTAEAPC